MALPKNNRLGDQTPVQAGLCRCGCGETEILGVQIELAQLIIIRGLITEIEASEQSEKTEELLFGGRLALYGLEGYCHQKWDHLPVQVGVPVSGWVELWRERVKDSAILTTDRKSRQRSWWQRIAKKRKTHNEV